MNNIVTFEQAVRLKGIGYNRECLYWYNQDGVKECPIEQGYMEYYYEVDCFLNDWNAQKIDRDLYGSYPPKASYSAPTVSEALDYLRDGYSQKIVFEISVTTYHTLVRYMYRIYEYVDSLDTYEQVAHGIDYMSNPLAESALLTAILEYLEKKG